MYIKKYKKSDILETLNKTLIVDNFGMCHSGCELFTGSYPWQMSAK